MPNHLYVGTRKGLFEYTFQNGSWQLETVHFLGDPVTQTFHDSRDGTLYAVLTLGHFGAKLRRRRAGQTGWEECAVPVFPPGSVVNDGPPPMDGSQPATKPASLKEIWSLEGADPNQPGTLWAGTIPGGLFRSENSGDSWQLVESLWNVPERTQWFGGGKDEPGIHSICVDPRDSRCITLGVSCGGVWHSSDNGQSWECRGQGLRAEYMPPESSGLAPIQDPHLIAQCTSAPDTIWMQHHNGIFRTHSRAQQWEELSGQPSSFGFAVAVHPHDPKTAWFVPAQKDQFRVPVDAKVVVSRTRDDGQSFEVLSNGLPSSHAYDLFYRHALTVDETGDSLAIGSTTGGLWTTSNGGDSWKCASQSLPPIYAVRLV